MMLLSSRTANYVEAIIHEGDDFDYRRWLERVRGEEAEAKQVPAEFSSGESVIPAIIGNLTVTPNCRDAPMHSGPALPTKSTLILRAGYRSDQNAGRKGSKGRLSQRLVTVCNAWDDFQECRRRDAVYAYLKAVFALVVDCKGRRRTKRLLRRAFQFAGLPFDMNADPFAAVIRCTSERNVDNKTISKWARALRYVARFKKPRTPLKRLSKKWAGSTPAPSGTRYISAGAASEASFTSGEDPPAPQLARKVQFPSKSERSKYPKSDRLLRRRELTRWANKDEVRRNKIALFGHLRRRAQRRSSMRPSALVHGNADALCAI
jgi:hypothetical protein